MSSLFGEDVARKLAEVEDRDGILKELRAEVAKAATTYTEAAAVVSAERKSAANKLAKLAEAQINALAMKVRFEIAVASTQQESSWTAHGWDRSSIASPPIPESRSSRSTKLRPAARCPA